tara:strand:- start:3576 stop:4898 length:1323 start_codon:yes stop_codon:yes gene_type:complete
MNLTLIQPAMGRVKGKKFMKPWTLEPLTISLLRGLVPDNFEVSFYDDRIEEIGYDQETDLVGITVETFNALRSYEIAEAYKKRGIPVVLGGVHPTLIPEEALKYGDSVVKGQAENTWPKLLEDFKKGQLSRVYNQGGNPTLGERKIDRSIFQGKRYLPIQSLEMGRGCTSGCEFCAIPVFFDGYNPRPLEKVLKEVEENDMQQIFLTDDNISAYPNKLLEFCEGMKPLKRKWVGQAGINIAKNDALLESIAESGCLGLLIGFESLNPDNIALMSKRINSRVDYQKAIKRINSYGIRIYGSFIMGYDNDTLESIDDTVSFAIDQKLFLANFYPLTPFPGTPLYSRLEQEGRLFNPKWWLDSNYRYGDFTFHPKNMEADELAEKVDSVKKKFYNYQSILDRGMEFHANIDSIKHALMYFHFNLRTRKEVKGRKETYLGLGHE